MQEEKTEEKRNPELNSEELNHLSAENQPAKDFLYFVFDLLKTGIIVFVIAFSLRYFVIQPFIVDGESMLPNFVNNEYILAEKISYFISTPKRGDVVIFRYPGNPSVSYIKRIIGLPGEKVQIKDNKITIFNSQHTGGVDVEEKYLPDYTLTIVPDKKDEVVDLGANEFFVLGDNRQHSSDSREWGKLPKANIIGRAWVTIMPLDNFGLHSKISYPRLSIMSLKHLFAKL